LAITLSEPVYVVVCYVLKVVNGGAGFAGFVDPVMKTREFALVNRWHALGVAVLLVVLSYALRRGLMSRVASVAGRVRAGNSKERWVLKTYFMMVVMSMMLCESAGILGLLYFLATGDLVHAAIFFAIAFAAKYGHWPRMVEFLRLLGSGRPAED
jgi:hypothetical protein